MESKIEWVEKLCDEVTTLDPSLFNTKWHHVSIPASVAAIRVSYYIGEEHKLRKLLYEKLYYLLVDDRHRWDSLSNDEQAALLSRLGISQSMVFTPVKSRI